MNLGVRTAFLAVLVAAFSCTPRTNPTTENDSQQRTSTETPAEGAEPAARIGPGADSKDVVAFSSGDEAMNHAMQKGRQTLDRFFAAYAAPSPQQERFSLKVALRSGTGVEYIWLEHLQLADDGAISGVLLNQPSYSTEHRPGDRIAVNTNDVVDWSYIEDGYLVGGYTLRVMFERYPQERRETLQRQLGYRIDQNKGL
jgi:uncharacterized protein YegJ (DUF2314 family)